MSGTPPDRRRSRRRDRIEEHGIVAARVRPGRDVAVVDVSADGALIESPHRLLPGASVELQLETASGRASVRGAIVRSTVARLRATGVCYRGAIRFERSLPWFTDEERRGYHLPAAFQGGVATTPSRS